MRALVLTQLDQQTLAQVQEITAAELPVGDVLVQVHYSCLNYKDGLAITGKGKIISEFPMVPGIDFVGTVEKTQDSRFQIGQKVLLTGFGVGEKHWGGLATHARIKADWLLPLPIGLSELQFASLGTAGLTAMLCVMALEAGGVKPDQGNVIVTGAGGGVGSIAVALLAQLGFQVTAVSGRSETHAMLNQLGAKKILSRQDFSRDSKMLEASQWAGAVDTAGGKTLATLLAQMQYNGVIAACGLADDMNLNTSVAPFILRGVRLQGVDSVMIDVPLRKIAWNRLARLVPAAYYQLGVHEIRLTQAIQAATDLMDNRITGRIVVDCQSGWPGVGNK